MQGWRSWPPDGSGDTPLPVLATLLAAQGAGPAGKDVYFPRLPGARSLEAARPYTSPLLEPCVSKVPAALVPQPAAAAVGQGLNLAAHTADFGVLPAAPLASTALGRLTPERLLKWAGADRYPGRGGCTCRRA